jgi:outer membrane receptor protein involved in Fe transport
LVSRFAGFVAAVALLFLSAIPLSSLAQSTASVTGTIDDDSGAPLTNATVTLRGPTVQSTTTDAQGTFSIANVTPGVYVFSVSKAGFTTAVQNDVALIAGQATNLSVRMQAATFSSLQTIARVRSNGRATLNTAAAAVSVVTTQTFLDQAQPQVTRVLSQIPGLQISFPSTSANAAAPGSITIPNIRDATSYETASLIDGHPISVGQYGDNVTTFLNSFMFGSIEVIKGPGADSPEVNNAIGGTTNFRTKDPTATPFAQMLVGANNHGGSYSNFDVSDTSGRLGFVFDFATNNNPSALNGKQVYYDPSGGSLNGNTLQGNATSSTVGNTASSITSGYPLVACCYELFGNLDQTAELLKFHYKLSSATTATVSYLGGQSNSDQNGNTSDFTNGQFTPGAGYSGSVPVGGIQVANIYAGAFNGEFNNEPIFQAEASTTLGNNSILARYYRATIERYQFQGTNPNSLDYNQVALYGTSSGAGNVNQTFNGTGENVGYNDFYEEPEIDKLAGGSFEFQHPIANNGTLTFSLDRTSSQSVDYSVFGGPFYSFNLPPGTSQLLTTALLRGHFYLGSKFDLTLADYFDTSSSTYPIACAGGNCSTQAAAEYGTGVTFGTTTNSHNDPRLGLVFRPNARSAVRLAMGSSIAPPFLGLLNQITSTPTYNGTVAIEQVSNGNIKPETGFGYDLGADLRLKDSDTTISGDVYLSNLFNRFFAQTVDTGLICGAANPCQTTGGAIPANTHILNQTNTNISNARFEGIELSIRRTPAVGFGYLLDGSVQKGYYYALPPYFYCSVPGPGCTQDQNVNIIAGQNTNGDGIGVGGLSYNGNMRIPYSEGYGQISYAFKNGAYASFGDTYFGNNNSLNEPAFGIANATLRYPVGPSLDLQFSGDNIFNAYPGILPIYGGGVPIELIGGQTAATIGNVLGPATWTMVLSTKLP